MSFTFACFDYFDYFVYDARPRSATSDRTRRRSCGTRYQHASLHQLSVKPASRRLSSIPRRYKIRSHSLQKWIPFVTMIPFLRLDYVSDLIYLWCGFSSQEPSGRTRRRPMSMFLDYEGLVDCTIGSRYRSRPRWSRYRRKSTRCAMRRRSSGRTRRRSASRGRRPDDAVPRHQRRRLGPAGHAP